ncbi:hypothetical protein GPALN_002988 [Globodera pallida]|nr:hypothetical protein GPALN_002988 [Globodera pallida]
MNAPPFFLLITLILPCFCSGLLQCKAGVYNTEGLSLIEKVNCSETQEYCSAVSCVNGDLVTMLWGCKRHGTCPNVTYVSGSSKCRCKMGEKGVNFSNEKLSFLPEAPTVTTEGK